MTEIIDQLLAEQEQFVPKEFTAAVLGISTRTLDTLNKNGKGPARHKRGRQIMYRIEDVRAYRTAQKI